MLFFGYAVVNAKHYIHIHVRIRTNTCKESLIFKLLLLSSLRSLFPYSSLCILYACCCFFLCSIIIIILLRLSSFKSLSIRLVAFSFLLLLLFFFFPFFISFRTLLLTHSSALKVYLKVYCI